MRVASTIAVALAVAGPGAAWGQGAEVAGPGPVPGLDHIPIAVRDLEAAGAQYRLLGFTLKPGRAHANGLRNLHAKFADGTELELITADSVTDGVTEQYAAHLARGDGPAFLALYAPEPGSVAEVLAGSNRLRRGGPYLYLDSGQLDYLFFGPRNASPTDRPEHFRHANGAQSLVAVWLAGEDLSAERAMLEAVGARFGETESPFRGEGRVPVARLPQGDVLLLPGSRQLVPGRRIVGATLLVADLEAARRVVGGQGDGPQSAAGMWLEFRE
jgi:Glyoxalase-like domain